jgi:methionyl-tRNA synthetase
VTRTYLTTTIPYVNARPHVGFALELRFHAVYWPAMLLSAGEVPPTEILVHGYLTADGRKISKSGEGGVDPAALAGEYGTDAVRWWLLREVPRSGDADFTVERLVARANDELANGLGNLVNRVVSMIHRYCDGEVPDVPPAEAPSLDRAIREAPGLIDAALAGYDFRRATAAVWNIVDEANRHINRVRPWENPDDSVLATLVSACRTVVGHLAVFLPDAAARVSGQVLGARLPPAAPVFRRR